jgi:hypothetical protein
MSNEKTQLSTRELNDVLENDIAQRHSYFQLKYFVIGKEPTIQSKMWQCLRELRSRKDSFESMSLEIEETKDKLELLDISIERIKQEKEKNRGIDLLSEKESDIRIRQAERKKKAAISNLEQIEERKKSLEEESRFFLETFKNLQNIEPLKNFDDLDAQKEYWSEKLSQKLNLKMLTNNHLDTELIETIVSLPDEMPIKKQTLATLNLRHANMIKQLKETMNHIENK